MTFDAQRRAREWLFPPSGTCDKHGRPVSIADLATLLTEVRREALEEAAQELVAAKLAFSETFGPAMAMEAVALLKRAETAEAGLAAIRTLAGGSK